MKHITPLDAEIAALDQTMGAEAREGLWRILDAFGPNEIVKALDESRLISWGYWDARRQCGCAIGVNLKDTGKAMSWATDNRTDKFEVWLCRGEVATLRHAIEVWKGQRL
jgi:hypothetical protein